jgi:predicted dehydrogenase
MRNIVDTYTNKPVTQEQPIMRTQNPLPTAGISRRRFLRDGTMAGALTLSFPAIVSSRSPNTKLNIAIIGAGGRGASNTKSVASENIVALCDVNATALSKAAERFPNARTYKDFRKLYEKVDDIDAVVVSTAEHTHAFATLPALKMKKHVFCEKPLTRDVREARIIVEAAKTAGVVTQMGTQIHAGDNYRRVVELIQSGAVGPVSEVHVWVSRAWGWQSEEEAKANKDIVFVQDRPKEEMPVPPDLDWDLWIGPAPYRPYHDVYLPGPKWYRWWDFGNGTMSDLGSHWIDLPFWALNLDAPLTVEASGPPPHPEIAPASMSAKYTYGARGDRPPLTLTWYQGALKPEIWKGNGIPQWPNGVLFVGKKGMLLSDYGKHVLLPEKEFADFQRPPQTIPPSVGHHQEWINACKTGAPTTCHFGYSGLLTEANHLGNVAYRVGRKIEWDTKNLRIPNAPETEKYLGREYRKGWSLS